MTDPTRWFVERRDGQLVFMYGDREMGSYGGSLARAEFLLACLNSDQPLALRRYRDINALPDGEASSLMDSILAGYRTRTPPPDGSQQQDRKEADI
jgi:hypothetical protein